jgi:hypothetical protein
MTALNETIILEIEQSIRVKNGELRLTVFS